MGCHVMVLIIVSMYLQCSSSKLFTAEVVLPALYLVGVNVGALDIDINGNETQKHRDSCTGHVQGFKKWPS